jgi:hypothetical protein
MITNNPYQLMQENHSQASHAPASQPTQRIQGREAPALSYFEFELREFNGCKAEI